MTILFLLIIVAAMPLMAAVSYRNIKTLEAEDSELKLSKAPIYFQSMIMQAGIALLAWQVSKKENFTISLGWNLSWYGIAASIIFLISALTLAYFSQKRKENTKEGTLQYLLPENGKERILWVLAVIVAAICEEYMYRGVLYQVLLQQTDGKIWASVLLSAIVFGFGHGTQGEKAIIQIIPFAIGFHLLALLSGGLLVPMIVHFIYNISVDLLFGKKITQRHP
jgi:membrane protease YdiL (CAAX protease family)